MKRRLGKMEMAEATTNEHFPFNAVIVLRISSGPSEETLRTLLEYLQRRHPLLGVHIHKEKKRYFFVSEGTPEIPLKVRERQNSDHWQQVAEEELNCNFDIFTGPLVRFTYLKGPGSEKESEIVISIQHSIMDAISAASLLHEILSICQEVETHGSLENFNILEPLPLLPAAEVFFPPAFKGLRRKWKTFLFILRQIGDEFGYRRRTKGKRKPPIHSSGKGKILPMKLSKETTGALIKISRKKRVTLNNLLTAAMLIATHKHLYDGKTRPLRHINTADLRPYLNPPLEDQYFGSYFAMMLFTVGMKENHRVWELAQQINEMVYSSLKRGDKFCANLLSYKMMSTLFRFRSFRMSNTALSFTGSLMLEKNYGKLEIRDVHAFVSNFVLGPEYTAMGRLFDNQVYWDILYLDSDMGHEQAEVIAGEIRTVLESAVEEES